jgi:hypothetical protein
MAPDDDPKVKELLDAATQHELAKWFQLPSFEQVAEAAAAPPKPSEDPEIAEVRERRARACAAVDPALLERIHVRTEVTPETLIKFAAVIDVRVREDVPLFDYTMAEKGHMIAEPREVEISEELKDDLHDVTPQALLRDLHRSETFFDKTFEIVDMAAEQRFDIVAEVQSTMTTSWKLPPLGPSPFEEERRGLLADRETRRKPWIQLPMPNRRVEE